MGKQAMTFVVGALTIAVGFWVYDRFLKGK